jgi:hypothetical protein
MRFKEDSLFPVTVVRKVVPPPVHHRVMQVGKGEEEEGGVNDQ